MSILWWFKNVSGLGMNVNKTKAVKIGATMSRSLPWKWKYGMEWTDTFPVLGIHYNVNKMVEIPTFNIEEKN